MKITRLFSKKDLQALVFDENIDGFEKIQVSFVGNRRWSLDYQLIFKFEDKFYATVYSVGATERQEESPFEYDNDEIKCVEVLPVEKTMIEYIEKDI